MQSIHNIPTGIHYPQLAYVKPQERRLVFWKCALVFFCSSIQVNPRLSHYLYTNDESPPKIDGVDCADFLQRRGVEVIFSRFDRFMPSKSFGTIFHNNFYKLHVLYEMSRAISGELLLMDSDVVWTNPLPQTPLSNNGQLVLYPVFRTRADDERSPTGISSRDLALIYAKLDPHFTNSSLAWIGGEIIGGRHDDLRAFTGDLEREFETWSQKFDPELHRFPNRSTIFDNDEFLLSYTVARYSWPFRDAQAFLKRIWTDNHGGGNADDLSLSAWHLPNEKLRGIQVLFDDFSSSDKRVPLERISAACGVPLRSLHYSEPGVLPMVRRFVVRLLKAVLPIKAYNLLRACIGRAPISN